MCSGRVGMSCSTRDTCRVTIKRHEHHPARKSYWIPINVNNYENIFDIFEHVIRYNLVWGSLRLINREYEKRILFQTRLFKDLSQILFGS